MKLKKEAIDYIQQVIKTAQLVGIDNIIIEPDCTRGMDEGQTVVICQTEDVPIMPFGSIGLNRLDTLKSRLDIVKTQEEFSISLVVDDNAEYARSLTMKTNDVKIEYRCANPNSISAPKRIADTFIYEFQITSEAVTMLQKGQSAMGSADVTFIGNNSGVSFEMIDINSDVFSYNVTDTVVSVMDESEVSFVNRYPIKTLLSLFKQESNNNIAVSQKGIMRIMIGDLTIYTLPKV